MSGFCSTYELRNLTNFTFCLAETTADAAIVFAESTADAATVLTESTAVLTESTALFLEAIAHLWNLVYLQLTDAGGDYKADYLEIDKMETRKLPIQIVAVIRRNKPTKDYRIQSVENVGLKGIFANRIIESIKWAIL